MSQRPEFSVVVVGYNSAAHVGAMVGELESALAELSVEVVVVDNASSDETFDVARDAIGNGRAIRLEENVGYGRGANEGLKVARGRYVIVSNDDISTNARSVSLLKDALDANPDRWLAAPALTDPSGEVQVGGRRFLPGLRDEFARIGDTLRRRHTRLQLPTSGPPVEIEFLLAAFLMAERDRLLSIGGFSEAFFMLGEDIDLCRRVKHLGGKVVYVPEAVVRHDQGLAEDRRVRGHEFSVRMLGARNTYYRIWLTKPERSAVNLIRAFGFSDQPFRLRYHIPKVIRDGDSLRDYRVPEPLRLRNV